MEFDDYKIAKDFDRAWVNFELDLPLKPLPDGSLNPFYVDRSGNPIAQLERKLLRPYLQPPKYFFSGHRGCGKSTELYRLAVNKEILKKYFPVHFSIGEDADINNLDFRDVLLAIGGQMFRQYRSSGKKLPAQLLKELNEWRGSIEEQITTIIKGKVSESEISGGLDAFFASVGAKVKLEPATRHELRQVFERDITGLIDVINKIATAILAQEKRAPLILIDDLDKPDLEIAKSIFSERRAIMLQPTCPIVYTVSSTLFYSLDFEAIRDRAVFLPNIRLHPQGKHGQFDTEGIELLRGFVSKRMVAKLIEPEALDLAARYSGGVFRELARVMRTALDRTIEADKKVIGSQEVEDAAAEIRGEYRRILNAEQRALLLDVYKSNRLDHPDKIAPLLQILAALEYANGEPWCDVHPTLYKLIEELNAHGKT